MGLFVENVLGRDAAEKRSRRGCGPVPWARWRAGARPEFPRETATNFHLLEGPAPQSEKLLGM